jgi:hypothetical protein
MIRHISAGRATLFVSESVFEFVFVFEGEGACSVRGTPTTSFPEPFRKRPIGALSMAREKWTLWSRCSTGCAPC